MRVDDLEALASDNTVGLVREGGRLKLLVPHGMAVPGMSAQRALSLLYRCFVVFRRSRRELEVLGPLDGVERRRGGARGSERGPAFHDALALDELFDKADPRSLLSLCDRRGRNAADPYRRFDRHLHRALFDTQGVAHLDGAPGPRPAGQLGRGDLVGLYCFLALDFYQHFLEVDPACAWGAFVAEGVALAADFQHRYLSLDDSLYRGDAAARQRSQLLLRHLLQRIDRCAVPRDTHYRQLHDALDRYLHAGTAEGDVDGLIWGVKDFWAVWESICLCHALAHGASDGQGEGALEHLHTCDFVHLPQGLYSQADEQEWEKRRAALFEHNQIRRRPDLLLSTGGAWAVVDFKYYQTPTLYRPKWQEQAALAKEERDFLNMEAYGLLLANHLARSGKADHSIELQMWLPGERYKSFPLRQPPQWNPPLSIRTLPTVELLERYVGLYQHSAVA